MRPLGADGWLAGACAGAVVAAFALDGDETALRWPGAAGALPVVCPFRHLTGMDCPLCGVSRSLVACADGDLGAAFAAHPAGPLLALATLGTLAAIAIAALRHTPPLAHRRGFVRGSWWLCLLCLGAGAARTLAAPRPAAVERAPNVVVVFVDDLGYADIGPFGGAHPTPHLDRLAADGMRLTDFLVPAPVCSASRAALLTGCYPRRVGIAGALGPRAETGLADAEVTIAELCRARGYATACFGKWHLGHHPRFLPAAHGFDEYFGLPYSNDMWPLHPDLAEHPPATAKRKRGHPPLPILDGTEVVDREVTAEDQAELTVRYTERAVRFIDEHADRPFFLYLAHSMVHVPLFVSERFAGKSGSGLFGDVVMEVDWSVGEVLAALHRNDLERDTLVVFTSDNGPWLCYGEHAGSAAPLREGKGTTFEGGCRVPAIVRWPGRIPAGATCDELASTIDLLPTVAALIGADLPDHAIDGKDIRPLLFGEDGARSPHDAFGFWSGGDLHAVRDRRFKLHFPHRYRTLAGRPGGSGGSPVPYRSAELGLTLFDLKADPGETHDVAAEHPSEVDRLRALAGRLRDDLGDMATERPGTGRRRPGRLQEGDARLVW